MKKALLMVLLALIQASVAPASVLVSNEPFNNNKYIAEKVRQATMSIMRSRGVNLLSVPSGALTNALSRAAQFQIDGTTVNFDVMVHINFSTQIAFGGTHDPTLKLHYDNWPTRGVHVFIFEPFLCSYNNSGTDTTGTEGCSGTTYQAGRMYATEGPWTWMNREGFPVKAAVKTGTQHGVFEAIAGYRVTTATNSFQVKDADSLIGGRKSKALEDSIVVWVRKRTATDSVVLIFCLPNVGSSGGANISAIKLALALADGYSRGKVFENRARTTKKHSLVIANGNMHGNPRNTVTLNANGIYCPSDNINADTCDFNNTRAGRDSLRKLGIPYHVALDGDSTQAVFAVTAQSMWMEDPQAKFIAQPMSGTFTESKTLAAAAGRARDPLGILRERTLWPVTPVSLTPSCATDTGSIFCGLKNTVDRIKAAVGASRFAPVLLPSMWDWTPKQWTSHAAGTVKPPSVDYPEGAIWGGMDSLGTVFHAAGFRYVLTNPTLHTSNVGMRLSSNFGATNAQAAPSGWVPGAPPLRAMWGGRQIGAVQLLMARWEPSLPWTWFDGHDIGSEYLDGIELGDYFPISAGPFWSHTFQLPMDVLVLPANSLGGPWGNPWPQRNGFRSLKSVVHGQRACNRYLYPWPDGSPKFLDEWVHLQ